MHSCSSEQMLTLLLPLAVELHWAQISTPHRPLCAAAAHVTFMCCPPALNVGICGCPRNICTGQHGVFRKSTAFIMNCHRARTCPRKPPQPSFKVARVTALWGLAVYLLFLFFLEKSAIHISISRSKSRHPPAPLWERLPDTFSFYYLI
jgi:hypothetical protein